MKRLLPIAIFVLVLAGCSSSPAETSTTPTATPTAEALPAVSIKTTCGLLFGSNVDGPAADGVDIVNRAAADLMTVSDSEISTVIAGLRTASKNADVDLVPYINAQTDLLQQLLDAKATGSASVDFSDYKAASLELLNQCERFL